MKDRHGRTAWTPDKVRQRIRVSMVLNRLHKHVLGDCEMSQTQVQAAKILLAKAVPDLRAIEHSGMVTQRYVHELTDETLAAIAAGGSARASETPQLETEPQGVH